MHSFVKMALSVQFTVQIFRSHRHLSWFHHYRHNGTVTVYSGTYGILEYPNDKNENTPIYILEDDGNWYIPAPKYYWKILLNEVTKEVSAFVGLNEPHSEDIPLENAFCTTSCDTIVGFVL